MYLHNTCMHVPSYVAKKQTVYVQHYPKMFINICVKCTGTQQNSYTTLVHVGYH